MIEIVATEQRTFRAYPEALRAEFADDLKADGMDSASDIEIVRHIWEQSGPDSFDETESDFEDVDFTERPDA